jgi:hypothetical protein
MPNAVFAKVMQRLTAVEKQANTIGENLDRCKGDLDTRLKALERLTDADRRELRGVSEVVFAKGGKPEPDWVERTRPHVTPATPARVVHVSEVDYEPTWIQKAFMAKLVADSGVKVESTSPTSKQFLPVDPDATPEERRAELEARGLKQCEQGKGKRNWRWTPNGDEDGKPCACETGEVYDVSFFETKTRTMPEFRAALDKVGLVKPALVGDGPWTVEELNAAGIEALDHEWKMYGVPGWDKSVSLMHAFQRNKGWGVSVADRRRLLHAADSPDVSPEWAAKVRKALGVDNA